MKLIDLLMTFFARAVQVIAILCLMAGVVSIFLFMLWVVKSLLLMVVA